MLRCVILPYSFALSVQARSLRRSGPWACAVSSLAPREHSTGPLDHGSNHGSTALLALSSALELFRSRPLGALADGDRACYYLFANPAVPANMVSCYLRLYQVGASY